MISQGEDARGRAREIILNHYKEKLEELGITGVDTWKELTAAQEETDTQLQTVQNDFDDASEKNVCCCRERK